MLSLIALFGVSEPLSAQEQKSPAKPIPTVKPHDPFAGKECSDCHKRVVSSKVNCLLAKEDLCEFCHKVPAEGGPARLVEAPEPLCFKCHKKDQFKGSFVHGPFAAGACITCHDPHGGNVPGMLRITGPQMCLECHKDMSARFTNARFRHKAAVTGCTGLPFSAYVRAAIHADSLQFPDFAGNVTRKSSEISKQRRSSIPRSRKSLPV